MSGLRSIPNVKIMADMVQGFGRKGDTVLAHITPAEAKLLKKRGGAGTVNPKTGLLEFSDGDSPGTSGGGGGEGGDNGVGGPGNGSSGDSVSGFGDYGSLGGGNYSESSIGGGGFGGDTSFSDFANDRSMRAGAPESEISTRDGGVNWNDYAMLGYDKVGTLGRLGQEITSPSQVGSRLGMPTAQNMGLLGPAMGFLAGPAFGLAMMAGAAMGRAQTPAEQQASMAEMAERGAQNSTGQDRDSVSGTGMNEGKSEGKLAGVTSVAPPPVPKGDVPEGWDEVGFLERNPEVKSAVSNGTWPSGYAFNKTYQQTSGVPYEQAMSTDRNDDLVKTRPGQVSPYRGY